MGIWAWGLVFPPSTGSPVACNSLRGCDESAPQRRSERSSRRIPDCHFQCVSVGVGERLGKRRFQRVRLRTASRPRTRSPQSTRHRSSRCSGRSSSHRSPQSPRRNCSEGQFRRCGENHPGGMGGQRTKIGDRALKMSALGCVSDDDEMCTILHMRKCE
jgi:hypothetical protein